MKPVDIFQPKDITGLGLTVAIMAVSEALKIYTMKLWI